jgi:hypothetical protein
MVIVVVDPHCPTEGVKVYKIDPTADVLMLVGDQVPVKPLLELVGSMPGVAFKQ